MKDHNSIDNIINEVYQYSEDNANNISPDDTRRPRLTLKHLSNIRKQREFRKLEQGKRLRSLSAIYNTS